mmetsp:Transcript_18986/g.41010  ORF Transcript_18986/g.41010 Transcript_18986/m.41010 type:complete len:205 (-) Transcript_18986:386-1000(-)
MRSIPKWTPAGCKKVRISSMDPPPASSSSPFGLTKIQLIGPVGATHSLITSCSRMSARSATAVRIRREPCFWKLILRSWFCAFSSCACRSARKLASECCALPSSATQWRSSSSSSASMVASSFRSHANSTVAPPSNAATSVLRAPCFIRHIAGHASPLRCSSTYLRRARKPEPMTACSSPYMTRLLSRCSRISSIPPAPCATSR